mgnify:CR=1 FL=1
MITEMFVPAKYKADIDHLVNGYGCLHGLRHRLAWAVMPKCIQTLTIAGLMVALHPDEVMHALFTKALTEAAANEADKEARR